MARGLQIMCVLFLLSGAVNTLSIYIRHQLPKYRLGGTDKWDVQYKHMPFQPFYNYGWAHLADNHASFRDSNARISRFENKVKDILKYNRYISTKDPETSLLNTSEKAPMKIQLSESKDEDTSLHDLTQEIVASDTSAANASNNIDTEIDSKTTDMKTSTGMSNETDKELKEGIKTIDPSTGTDLKYSSTTDTESDAQQSTTAHRLTDSKQVTKSSTDTTIISRKLNSAEEVTVHTSDSTDTESQITTITSISGQDKTSTVNTNPTHPDQTETITDETPTTTESDSVDDNSTVKEVDESTKTQPKSTVESTKDTSVTSLDNKSTYSSSSSTMVPTENFHSSTKTTADPSSTTVEAKPTKGFTSSTIDNKGTTSVKDNIWQDSTSESNSIAPDAKDLSEDPDHTLKISSIKTAKMVVSIVFLVIALIAAAVLIIYFIRVKRRQVQYDQITLLP